MKSPSKIGALSCTIAFAHASLPDMQPQVINEKGDLQLLLFFTRMTAKVPASISQAQPLVNACKHSLLTAD